MYTCKLSHRSEVVHFSLLIIRKTRPFFSQHILQHIGSDDDFTNQEIASKIAATLMKQNRSGLNSNLKRFLSKKIRVHSIQISKLCAYRKLRMNKSAEQKSNKFKVFMRARHNEYVCHGRRLDLSFMLSPLQPLRRMTFFTQLKWAKA